ncbi:MAG: nucleotidyltransferase family protein [Pseudomonadota bacterium]
MSEFKLKTAMVLAAGFGKRLRPLTNDTPKPLVPVDGVTMLDRTLNALVASGIEKAVVNMHYLGEQIADHCAQRTDIECVISDERDAILETGGGTVKALSLLGTEPFLLVNADTFWVDFGVPTIDRMAATFNKNKMDILLLLCRKNDATGHSGGSDFLLDSERRLVRAQRDDPDGVIYAGAAIYAPSIFDGAQQDSHSLNIYFDKAIANGRLYGHVLEDGHWFTVGTPDGLIAVEEKLKSL